MAVFLLAVGCASGWAAELHLRVTTDKDTYIVGNEVKWTIWAWASVGDNSGIQGLFINLDDNRSEALEPADDDEEPLGELDGTFYSIEHEFVLENQGIQSQSSPRLQNISAQQKYVRKINIGNDGDEHIFAKGSYVVTKLGAHDLTATFTNSKYWACPTCPPDIFDTGDNFPARFDVLGTIHVDGNTPDNNDGSNWAKAYRYLQDALAVAGAGSEIWVADGNYYPDASTAEPNGSGDRTATFQLISGVALYGGYAGYGAPDPNERNVELYETILSGDLDGNDVDVNNPWYLNDEPTRAENSYHVVTGSGTDGTAVLDGFTTTGGNANGDGEDQDVGGGMYNKAGSPTVTNCIFSDNSIGSEGCGGGMYNYNSSPTVANCTFSKNAGCLCFTSGGGMYNYNSGPNVVNCTFSGNHATRGGGMMNNYGSSPTVTNCIFSDNMGEGMKNYYSDPHITNCTFSGNGDGGMDNSDSSPTVTNCIFSDTEWGSGMYNGGGSPMVSNCTFSSNQLGGMYNSGSSPTVTNCTFSGNLVSGMDNFESSPMVSNCTFSGNTDSGMYNFNMCNPTVTNCIFWGDEIIDAYLSSSIVTYSDVQGGWAGAGGNNIDANPCFVDADNADPNLRDYRLKPGSPCIDAGDNNSVPADSADLDNDGNAVEPTPWDLDGRDRFGDGDCNDSNVVDMGAYEFAWAYIGDFDGECDVDSGDYAIFGLAWLTEEGQPGYNPACDISIPADKYIDWLDLDILTDNWLAGL
jgi:parallel beta-helix repeat protein